MQKPKNTDFLLRGHFFFMYFINIFTFQRQLSLTCFISDPKFSSSLFIIPFIIFIPN